MKKNSSVDVTKTDISTTSNIDFQSPLNIITGVPNKGPRYTPIIIGSKIKPIKWYQIWRYHLIPKYNKEAERCKQLFVDTFGQPDSIK